MTDYEKAVVTAYTGYAMLVGDKLGVLYEYLESKVGRPVFTHEMCSLLENEKVKASIKDDFIKLCQE